MEDIRMMLGKRPLESFWFFTWCISGPIITLVKHLLFNSKYDIFQQKNIDRFLFINYTISNTKGR